MVKYKKSSRLNSYIWMLINTLVWGAAFIAVKPSLSVTTPIRYLLYRYLFAVILSLPILWHYLSKLKEKRIKIKKLIFPIIWIELLGTTLILWMIYEGLKFTSAIEANLLTMTLPLFTILAGVYLLKEKQEHHENLGLVVAIFGTLLLTIYPAWKNGTMLQLTSLQGNFLILAAMLLSGIYYIAAKKYYAGIPKFFITTLSFYVGLISFAILAFLETPSIDAINRVSSDLQHPSVWIAAGYMALFGSIIGLTAYYQGQESIEASEASLFTYLQPAVAIPLGILLLGETIYPAQLIALGLIIIGVFVAEQRV